LVLALGLGLLAVAATVSAATPLPSIKIGIGEATGPHDVSLTLQILFLLTVLSLAPAILMLTTSFTRIVIVLSFLRQALGTQNIPPNQVLLGLALFLTFFNMNPVFSRINDQALQPYLKGKSTRTWPSPRPWSRCGSSCFARPGRRTWPSSST
jgi:flagellar biosynthetic protein FliP